jgi:hypothetical protein
VAVPGGSGNGTRPPRLDVVNDFLLSVSPTIVARFFPIEDGKSSLRLYADFSCFKD